MNKKVVDLCNICKLLYSLALILATPFPGRPNSNGKEARAI